MERRQTPRFAVDGYVQLTALSATAGRQNVRVLEMSARGVRVELLTQLQPGTPVRLDLDDCLVLGEVAWCSRSGGTLHAGLKLEEALQGLGDLSRLVASILGEEDRRPTLVPTR